MADNQTEYVPGREYVQNGVKVRYEGDGCFCIIRTKEEKIRAYTPTPEFLNQFGDALAKVLSKELLEQKVSEPSA